MLAQVLEVLRTDGDVWFARNSRTNKKGFITHEETKYVPLAQWRGSHCPPERIPA